MRKCSSSIRKDTKDFLEQHIHTHTKHKSNHNKKYNTIITRNATAIAQTMAMTMDNKK